MWVCIVVSSILIAESPFPTASEVLPLGTTPYESINASSRIAPLNRKRGASFLPLLAKRDLSRLGSGERNLAEATGPQGPSERERASQQGRGEEHQGTGGNLCSFRPSSGGTHGESHVRLIAHEARPPDFPDSADAPESTHRADCQYPLSAKTKRTAQSAKSPGEKRFCPVRRNQSTDCKRLR